MDGRSSECSYIHGMSQKQVQKIVRWVLWSKAMKIIDIKWIHKRFGNELKCHLNKWEPPTVIQTSRLLASIAVIQTAKLLASITVERTNILLGQQTARSQSESESLYDWQPVSPSVFLSSPVWGSWPDIYFEWKLQSCPYGAPSLTRGRVSHLSVIVDSKSLSIYAVFINLQFLKSNLQYIQGLGQSRLSTANYALFLVVFARTAV
jgi:hypothetical protein